MYFLKATKGGESNPLITLKTKERRLARSFVLLGKENGLDVKVTEEIAPRPVKFKGVD